MTEHHDEGDHAELFALIGEAGSEDDLIALLTRIGAAFGFSGCAITTVPPVAQGKLDSQILASNWPRDFLRGYDELGLLRNSPVFTRLRTSVLPLVWTVDDFVVTRGAELGEKARELFLRHGLRSGVFVPVHGPDGTRAAVSWEGDRDPPQGSELNALNMLAIHFFDAYHRLRKEPASTHKKLSEREAQVLGWAANGKTSVEIATILSLSDHTVNSYLNSAMRKLDCVNRTQLVAKALRLGIIS